MFHLGRSFAQGAAAVAAGLPIVAALDASAYQRLLQLSGNTLLLAAGACILSVPVGTLLAFLLVRTDLPLRRTALVALATMLLVPLYVQAAAWKAALGTQGVFSHAGLLDGMPAAILTHAAAAVPWVVLIVGLGLWQVEPELEEAALLDAAPRRVALAVTLRRTWGWIAAASLWVAATAAAQMTVTDLYQVRTLAEEVYTQFAVTAEPGEATLGLLPGLGLCVALIAAVLLVCVRLVRLDATSIARRTHRFALGSWRWLSLVLVAVLLGLVIAIPLGSLIYKCGVEVVGPQRERIFSPAKLLRVLGESPDRYQRELLWSLGTAALAATTAVVGALALVWSARRSAVARLGVLGIVAAVLAVPGCVLGIGIIVGLNRPDVPLLRFLYSQSIAGLWLVQTIEALPLAVLVLWSALRSVPASLLDAAALDGAGAWRQLRFVVLPMRWRAVAIAWLVGFALALGELDGSVLVYPPRAKTITVRIFELIHYGVEDQIASICLLLVLMSAAVAGLLVLLARTRGQRSESRG